MQGGGAVKNRNFENKTLSYCHSKIDFVYDRNFGEQKTITIITIVTTATSKAFTILYYLFFKKLLQY